MSDVKLKPCPNPWCAHKRGLHIIWDGDRRHVHCIDCGVVGPGSDVLAVTKAGAELSHEHLDEQAITAWNRRSHDARLIEALEDALFCMESWSKIHDPEWDGKAEAFSAIGKARDALSQARESTP